MARRVRVELEIELSEPIGGRLLDEVGEEHSFEGWLELHSALEAVCADARADGDQAAGSPAAEPT